MKTQVQFKNLQGMEHIREYVASSFSLSLARFEMWKEFDSQIILGTDKARSENHRPVFHCELILRSRDLHSPVIVKKSNANFYTAIHDTLHAAEKILRRRSKARVSKRRRQSSEIAQRLAFAS